MRTLTHITDVGAPAGDGVDSTERIRTQYQRLGVNPHVVTAGHSPLHVAFTACTDLAESAREAAAKAVRLLEIPVEPPAPKALNCAPRNEKQSRANGEERHIIRVRHQDPTKETQLIYGEEATRWALAFRGKIEATVDKILAIPDVIKDTSNGSQFRSAEHLPIVHLLESLGKLDQNAETQEIDPETIENPGPRGEEIVVLPPDEFGNGRILVAKDLLSEIEGQEAIRIPGITNTIIAVHNSLTEVIPGELSVWKSSNHLPGGNLAVLNLGTRWGNGHTEITDQNAIGLAKKLSKDVGSRYRVR